MTADAPSDKHETEPGFLVADDDDGVRLDKWLAGRETGLTRTRLRALIEEGQVRRDGVVVRDPAEKVRAGARYALVVPPAEPALILGEAIALDIVYEDDDLIVVDKPAGMVVHPAPGAARGTLVNALIAHCGASLSGVGGVARPGVVHRIDKDTSGLLVAAKHDRAHQALAVQFAAHSIERVYDAIACGAPRPGVGVIDAPVARSGGDRKKMAVLDEDDEREDARRAVTHYRIVEAFGKGRAKLAGDALASRLECRLETGRTHQIRAHLAHIGHPLIGDSVYGRAGIVPGLKAIDAASEAARAQAHAIGRQALHARVLGFEHPSSGDQMRFERDAPTDFQALISALRAL